VYLVSVPSVSDSGIQETVRRIKLMISMIKQPAKVKLAVNIQFVQSLKRVCCIPLRFHLC
jgi:hypothetical protein